MGLIDLSQLQPREAVPGFHGKFIHTDNVTVAFWDIDAGSVLPDHAHPHEQVTSVLAGQFELTVAGETRLLEAGMVAVIDGNVRHSGRAVSDCRLFDVFHPVREIYR